jgi:hypothetical protein
LLAEEIAEYSFPQKKKVTTDTVVKLYKTLIKHKQRNSAAAFFLLKSGISNKRQTVGYSSVSSLIQFGGLIDRIIQEASAFKLEISWEFELVNLLYFRCTYPKDDYQFKRILKILIERGCDANCIKQTLIKADDINFLKETFTYYISKLIVGFPRIKQFRTMFRRYKRSRDSTKKLPVP